MTKINEIKMLFTNLNELRTATTTINIEDERFGANFAAAVRAGTNGRRSNTRINQNRNHCTSDSGRIIRVQEIIDRTEEIEAARNTLVAKISKDINDSYETTEDGEFRLTFEDIPVSGRMTIMEAATACNMYKEEMGITLLVQRIR